MNSFLIVCKPSADADWREFFHFDGEAPSIENLPRNIQLIQESTAVLLHPVPAASKLFTFGVWRDRKRFAFENRQLINEFENERALLFFSRAPEATDDRLLLTNRSDGIAVLYRRLQAGELRTAVDGPGKPGEPFLPDSRATRAGHFERCGYRLDPRGAGDRDIRADLDGDAGRCRGEPVAWLNPIVLRLAVAGNELSLAVEGGELRPARAGVSVQHVLRHLVDRGSLLFVEPLFVEEFDGRVLLLQELHHRYRDHLRATNSPVERLLWGDRDTAEDADEPCWKPFLVLDALGGSFSIRRHGTGRPRYCWKPPPDLSPNARWLADYWLRLWPGTLVEDPWPKRVVSLPHPAREWPEPTYRSPVSDDADAAATVASCAALLGRAAGADGDGPPLGWLASLLQREMPDRPEFRQAHYGFFARAGTEVRFWEAEFLDHFARGHLAPRSPVHVELPPLEFVDGWQRDEVVRGHEAAVGGLAVELTRSPLLGAGKLLRHLFEHNNDPPSGAPTERRLEYEFGWWNDWFTSLFSDPAETPVRFVVQRPGLVLKQKRLGEGVLGVGPAAYQQDREIAV
jgi:hypothetical protein